MNASRIQHNIASMNSYRNYTNNSNRLGSNLEKLSSGYKINRAGDDAAGLAISEKMRAQITGLEVAQKNAKDGISVVQTAEGALTEVHDMLNRMYSLAEQSANGIYNPSERQKLQDEVDALTSEIDRISKATNFNGITLLDGSLATTQTTSSVSMAANSYISDIAMTTNLISTAGTAAATLSTSKTYGAQAAVLEAEVTVEKTTAAHSAGVTVSIGNFVFGSGVTFGTNGTHSDGAVTFEINGVAITVGYDASSTGAEILAAVTAKIANCVAEASNWAVETSITGSADGKGLNVTQIHLKYEGAATAGDAEETALNDKFGVAKGGTALTIDRGATSDVHTVTIGTTSVDVTGDISANFAASIEAAITGLLGSGDTDWTLTGHTGITATGTATLTLTAITAGKVDDSKMAAIKDWNTTAATEGLDESADIVLQIGGQTFKAEKSALAEGTTVTLVDTANTSKTIEFTLKTAISSATGITAEQVAEVVTKSEDTALLLQIGDDSQSHNQMSVAITAMDSNNLFGNSGTAAFDGNSNQVTRYVDIMSAANANAAMSTIKAAIEKVSVTRGNLGAIQNRLEHTINNLGTTRENLQDAESAIRDTDVAEEMMKYTKNSIMNQAAQAMLAQANQLPQGVLQLLQ